jgi:hypothetical protein
MSLFKRERAVDIVAASGMVRVTVNPRPAWIAILLEAAGIIAFGVVMVQDWASMALWLRALLLWAIASAIIGWFYQLSGSETVAFSAQKLATSKETLGWNRTREYSVANCRELEWREQSGEGDNAGLQCKVGWRTIKFAHHISEDEAQEILTALQTNLPDVAQQICAMPDSSKKHFTTLNLS